VDIKFLLLVRDLGRFIIAVSRVLTARIDTIDTLDSVGRRGRDGLVEVGGPRVGCARSATPPRMMPP